MTQPAPVPAFLQFTDVQKHEMLSLFNAGKTQAEIGILFGVPRRTIGKVLDKLGVARNHKEAQLTRRDPDFDSIVARLYTEDGLTIHQIAAKLDKDPKTVHKITKGLMRASVDKPAKSVSERYVNYSHSDIIKSYQELKSMTKVAEKFGCAHRTVLDIITDAGIQQFTTSELFSGEGNPFHGKEHTEENKQKAYDNGCKGGDFWIDNQETVELFRQKAILQWADPLKRAEQSKKIALLKSQGKCNSKRGSVVTRFGIMDFDSSYEMKFIEWCENNPKVMSLEREFELIEYQFDGTTHHYIPDFLVLFSDGSYKVVEVKAAWWQEKPKEQAKIAIGREKYGDSYVIVEEDFNGID